MKQEKINYDEIMALGFNEQVENDSVYEAQNGYPYSVITKDLTKRLSLDWEKETKLCSMIRVDKKKGHNIVAELPIMNLEHLKEIIDFFCLDKPKGYGLGY